VAAAVKPDAEYIRLESGDWVGREAYPDAEAAATARGEELVGLTYAGPFDHLPAVEGIEHRVIPWDEVTMDEGTGIVHIAPGCGAEDFELSRVHDLPVLVPIDESGRMVAGYGPLEGFSTDEVEDIVIEDLRRRELLVDAGRIVHRYPTCWRCGTPLVFRVVDDWFIACDEIRQPMLDANATVEWTPAFYSKRMDDWLRNMGDWNISRKRYFGLPLPFYPCGCGHLNVVGSRAELEERAVGGLEQLQELHRPWIDEVPIRCEHCDAEVRRIVEVGDAWLDAGIVPFATLGWQSPEWIEGGYATGAARGLSGADLPDHAYWETWFPGDWVSEMREQIRLWFYSMSFMSVTLVGRTPYERVLTYEKLLDDTGREMHRSWGNAIEAGEALESMGADVMRWQFCGQPPSQNLLFGYGRARETKRELLTLWNSISFFVQYASIEGFRPEWGSVPGGERLLDRWLAARTDQFLSEAEAGYEAFMTVDVLRAFQSFVDDVSNWYIRRSRRRFYGDDREAFEALWHALVQGVRAIGPVMPFLAEYLWQRLVAGPCEDAPRSVFLAGWPEAREYDRELLEQVEETRRVVELGRKARDLAGIKHRQPLPRLALDGAENVDEDQIKEELRVKDVVSTLPDNTVRLKPNLPLLGPKLGKDLGRVRQALDEGRFDLPSGGEVHVEGFVLAPDEVLGRERTSVDPAWVFMEDDGVVVALDTTISPELHVEGRVLDLIHRLNSMRKEAGLELTDRISVTLPADQADLLDRHADWIKDEVLAVSIDADGGAADPQIAKA
jgi:isoleucyl-tRNA synthetase